MRASSRSKGRSRARGVREREVIGVDELLSVLQVVAGFPSVLRFVISFPFDEVLELVAEVLGTEDFLHHVFFYVFNDDWRWRGLNATRDGIFDVRRKERDMEDRMDLHAGGELELVGMRGYLSKDFIGAQTFSCELLRRTIRVDVRGFQPDLLSNFVAGALLMLAIIESLLILLN